MPETAYGANRSALVRWLLPMPNSGITTVSSGRASEAEIDAQANLLEGVPAVARILDAVPAMLMVLNRHRQVVLANNSLARFAGAGDPAELRGLRAGEIFGCVHASEGPDGCGSTESCTACGAFKAMQCALIGRATTEHARLVCMADRHEAQLELEVSASPLEIAGETFTLVYLVDASDRARRHWFERAVIPQALGLSTELEILAATTANPAADDALRSGSSAMLLAASRRLTSLLREFPEMAEAEAGGYACATVRVPAAELLTAAAGQAANDSAALGRRILFEPWDANLVVDTDPVLARRILEKMLLNALEATPVGGTVTLGCREGEGVVELWVRNSGAIPRRTQLQIFQRSFSTKGPGRGYGTYFVKLMTERCLGGTVSFRSEAGEGTTFSVRLPQSGREQGTVMSRALTAGLVIGDPDFRDALAAVLRQLNVQIVFAVADAGAEQQKVERTNPDVLILDFGRPGAHEVMAELKHLRTPPAVIGAHEKSDPDVILWALRAGVREFIYPPVSERVLANALDAIARERVIDERRP